MAEYTIKTYTPRLRLQYRALLRKATHWYEAVADEIGVEKEIVDRDISDFLHMGIRVENLNGAFDFEFAAPHDTPEQVKEKFLAYLDTENMAFFDEVADAINALDTPDNPDTGPDEPTEKKV